MNAAEAMKYAISGGVTSTVDEEEEKDAVHLSMGSTGPSMGSTGPSMGSTGPSMGSTD
jgi:hypothetical protein